MEISDKGLRAKDWIKEEMIWPAQHAFCSHHTLFPFQAPVTREDVRDISRQSSEYKVVLNIRMLLNGIECFIELGCILPFSNTFEQLFHSQVIMLPFSLR